MNNQKGVTLIEVLIAITILTLLMGGGFIVMSAGQEAWGTTDTQIRLQQNLRQTVERITKELRESGSNSVGTMQVQILDNAGTNNTDVLRFSVPVVCEPDGNMIDANGDVANWGASWTWGCFGASCMDADGDCTVHEYSAVEYRINASNQLERHVLDAGNVSLKSDILAQNISDFQATISVDQNVVSLNFTAFGTTNRNRAISINNSVDVLLRNRG